MPERFKTSSGVSYLVDGTGDTLVLVHGFPLDGRMWQSQLDALAAHRRVIVPDLPGFGQSEGNQPFTIDSQAAALHAMLVELNALPCVFAGLSMGGYIALAFARRYPEALRGLILVDTRAEADTQQGRDNRDKMIALVRSAGSVAIADEMIIKLLAPQTMGHRPQIVKSIREMMEQCPPLTIEHALAAMRDRKDQIEFLPSIAVPTLIVVGDADTITPPEMAERMCRLIVNAHLEFIRGAGHMSPMEQPSQVNAVIERFLRHLGAN